MRAAGLFALLCLRGAGVSRSDAVDACCAIVMPTSSASTASSACISAIFASRALVLRARAACLRAMSCCQCRGGGAIRRFLRHARGPCQDAAIRPDEDFRQFDPVVGQHKLPRLVGMLHAARLDDGQRAGALSRLHQVVQHQPGVDQRGNADLALLGRVAGTGQAGEQGGDLPGLQQIDHAHQHRPGIEFACRRPRSWITGSRTTTCGLN